MRVAVIAGLPGSGKTDLLRSLLIHGFDANVAIAVNNEQSRDRMEGRCARVDVFPFRSPCARSKQFKLKLDSIMADTDAEMFICEPPGTCTETSAAMVNPVYVSMKNVSIAPLITVIDGSVELDVDSKHTSGLKLRNMLDESDCIVIMKSDLIGEPARKNIASVIDNVNPSAEIIFASSITGEGVQLVKEMISGNSEYSRPLYN